jgi:type IV pilus assembly protein PilM
VKLPGLVQYLSKHLGYEVREIESFKKLSGSSVVTSPSFKDNLMAFGACYGLCLQGLNRGKLGTNLLPRELLTERMIRAKKPWAVAGVGALVLACALNYVFYSYRLNEVHEDRRLDGVSWKEAVDGAKNVSNHSSSQISKDTEQMAQLELLKKIGSEVVGASDRRVLWLEVMRAINTSLPPMKEGLLPTDPVPDPKTLPFTDRKDLKVEYIESQFYPDLAVWFSDDVKTKWLQINSQAIAAPAAGAAATPTPAPAAAAAPSTGAVSMDPYGSVAAAPTTDVSGVTIENTPKGPGWVFEIKGHHFYNSSDPAKRRFTGAAHVRDTLIRNLEHGTVEVPLGPNQPPARFTMKELGIGFAILARDPPIKPNFPIPNPNYTPPVAAQGSGFSDGGEASGASFPGATIPGAGPAVKEDPDNPQFYLVPRYDFIVQFCWVETPLNVRIENMKKAELERKAKAEAAAAAAAANPDAAAAVPPAASPADPAAQGAIPPATAPAGALPPAAVPVAPPVDPAAAPVAPVPGVPAAPIPAIPDAAGGALVPPAASPMAPVEAAGAPAEPAAPAPAPMVPAPMVPAPMVPAVPDVPM